MLAAMFLIECRIVRHLCCHITIKRDVFIYIVFFAAEVTLLVWIVILCRRIRFAPAVFNDSTSLTIASCNALTCTTAAAFCRLSSAFYCDVTQVGNTEQTNYLRLGDEWQ